MARAKAPASRPKLQPVIDVGFDDLIPSSVLAYFFSLPKSEAANIPSEIEERGQRATKRLKVTKRCETVWSTTQSVSAEDVGQYIRCRVIGDKLDLASRSYTAGSFILRVKLKAEQAAQGFVQSPTDPSKYGRERAGTIWEKLDFTLNQKNGVVDFHITCSIMWTDTPSPYYPLREKKSLAVSQGVIDKVFPGPQTSSTAWSPMDFYDAIHVPSKHDSQAAALPTDMLDASLFPYQKRTLRWMMSREGVAWSSASGAVAPLPNEDLPHNFDTFREVHDVDGQKVFLSDTYQTLTRNLSAYQEADRAVKGGILAEEMGLGKTLEILGLIVLHKFGDTGDANAKRNTNGHLQTGATLIVTPASLQQQWINEINRHAPNLRVLRYRGCRKHSGQSESAQVEELDSYDIVVTTYSVLAQELHFAEEPPDRAMRHEKVYQRQKSPLVQMVWWRVCLDEAQMIESGVSHAAAVVNIIPRVHAWAITGTPVKDNIEDLRGLLRFLRYPPFSFSSPGIWHNLTHRHKPMFQKLFNSLAIRHTKTQVRDEIALPPQKRYVISMPFSAVEEQHYQTLYKEMAEACDLDIDGAPVVDDWEPDVHETMMRTWLTRLRQTALHPEVGAHNRRMLGSNKDRPMRTVDEVLNAMLEQSETSIRSDERAYLSSRLTRGQLYENSHRVKEAFDLWTDVCRETTKMVEDGRAKLKFALEEQKAIYGMSVGEARPVAEAGESSSEDEPDGSNISNQVSEQRRRLRSALELHHKAVFFCANAVFQIRDNAEMTVPDSEEFKRLKKEEDEGYEEAKFVRREILRESYHKANRHMTRIVRKAKTQTFVEVADLVLPPERGIESGRVIDRLEVLFGELNLQANTLDEWRESVIQLLLKPLVDEENEAETTGEELADSAKLQDELMVYVQVLRSTIADRQDAITGQTNELVKHETDTSIRLARNGGGPAPEKLLELLEIRGQVKPKMAQISMRGAIGELRGLQTKLLRDESTSAREAMEGRIVTGLLKSTQKSLGEQLKAAVSLESEIEGFKNAMNARLEYYRQLQIVSDAVLPYDGPRTHAVEERMKRTEDDLLKKLSSTEAKHRYLLNLKETGSKSNEPRMCVICQMPFMTGVLTVCGHQFCKECMMMWFKAHRNCPVCKRPLKSDNLHDITIKPQQLQIHGETQDQATREDETRSEKQRVQESMATTIYSEFNATKLAEIQAIDLDGPSFTTKVDTLVRHLFWLRESDPGAKSIIFSQYKDFLAILQNAFRRFRIGFASIDDAKGIVKFKNDPACECFLLHARAHSSGLNLVNASHVFLCEPLLNTALELQAIARVDRIGQMHPTTVWLYLVSGTVEESIYNLSVLRRMAHMRHDDIPGKGKSRETSPELLATKLEEANTRELEQAALSKLLSKDRSAGEMVEKGDLWACLFGHLENKRPREEEAEDSNNKRLQETAVRSYLAAEAAEARV